MLEEISISSSLGSTATIIGDQVSAYGYALVSVPEHVTLRPEVVLNMLDDFLSMVAEPIRIFSKHQAWRPISVKLDRPPDRSEGIGESPLHMDFVNADNPPDLVLLYCQRSDPVGGGKTILAPTSTVDELDHDIQAILKERRYSDGQITNLINIGADINPFAVLSLEGRWRVRYTGQLLKSAVSNDTLDALREFDRALHSNALVMPLAGGHAVLIDQHKMVHGRLSLGEGQHKLSEESRRLIWQRFGRLR